MESCLFCELISNKLPTHGLYEDDTCIVILDRESLGFGHCMLIPKRHVVKIYELDEQEYIACFALARRLASALEQACQMPVVGYSAFGSGLPHAHLHLVPHSDITVMLRSFDYVRRLTENELEDHAQRLRPLLLHRL